MFQRPGNFEPAPVYVRVVGETDAQLIVRARTDPDALGELYLRYRGPLYAWFRAHLPEPAASELTAELFAQVALTLGRFRDEAGGTAAPWLYGIAKNLVRRYYQKGRIEARARRRLGLPIQSYDLEAVDNRLEAGELKGELAAALYALPQEQRAAVQLRVVEERPYADVAARLGCSETAARIRVMRALGRLARLLDVART